MYKSVSVCSYVSLGITTTFVLKSKFLHKMSLLFLQKISSHIHPFCCAVLSERGVVFLYYSKYFNASGFCHHWENHIPPFYLKREHTSIFVSCSLLSSAFLLVHHLFSGGKRKENWGFIGTNFCQHSLSMLLSWMLPLKRLLKTVQ